MSGHSKWSTIKHKKGAADAKRGKIFTRLIRELTISARSGGSDISGNPRLRSAVAAARAANMPGDNIERAIKRGTGELEGVNYEEITYEGYGPGGAAVILEVVTDNRNRTVGEIRNLFTRYNGNMGETGCVGWMFRKCGVISVPQEGTTEDHVMELALDAGADDVKSAGTFFEVLSPPALTETVAEKLRTAGVTVETAEVAMVPANTVKLEGRDAEVMLRLYENLEDHDDVQHVWSNFDIDDDVIAQFAG